MKQPAQKRIGRGQVVGRVLAREGLRELRVADAGEQAVADGLGVHIRERFFVEVREQDFPERPEQAVQVTPLASVSMSSCRKAR
ncbi:MAG TPA: hypothetical protein ENN74_00590 [Firmicutes bacterium]|nr:hypothetical protein [Bacillota bacterium]